MEPRTASKPLPRPSRRGLTVRGLTLLVLALLFAPPNLARPAAPLPHFAQINEDGFGDRQNSYSWSMAWFKNKLYVGTNRNFPCVERATVQFYFPNVPFLYTTNPDPDITCTPDPLDLDLRAEIWRYTPETQQWERVFQAPEIPIPDRPGKFTSRDIGFRDMTVFREPDGTEALYVAGVTAREYIPGLPPPRILRTTDGSTFEPVPQDPGTVLGDLTAIGFRAMAVYKGRLYITASRGLRGEGVILEAANPAGGNDEFRPVSPPDLLVFELQVFMVFNGSLYVGAGDETTGYSVWKTDARGSPPYEFIPIVTGGAGRGALVTSVLSMHPFKGQLYVGSSGATLLGLPSELIRINPDDTWELVVGNPRQTSQGFMFPLSGLPDGFGNPFNVHFWRMQEHNGALYLGTNDLSWAFRVIPGVDAFLQQEYGFDLYKTENGTAWTQVTRDGFGDQFNFGARTLASTPDGLFLGTVNYVTGTEVWLGADMAGEDNPPPGPPDQLKVKGHGPETALSWVPSQGAVRFHIFRAEHVRNQELGIPGLRDDAWVPGPWVWMAETSDPFFQDSTAVEGMRYSYGVQAVDGQGQPSALSNMVIAPSLAPAAASQ
jgi:hypothetical protein